jgi:hypothetical protein
MSSAQFEQLRSRQFPLQVLLLQGPLELAQLLQVMLQVMLLV